MNGLNLGIASILLSKSVNENGVEVYRMKGKMSSTSRDDDGQYLNPSGFDMSEFMATGYMNWHHQSNKNPLAIIGKPISYELDKEKNEMWVDFELFPDNPMAKQVYQLQEVLEKRGMGLGLSLEGTATEVLDPKTKKLIPVQEAIEKKIPLTHVEKAKIVGCAVTPAPKNRDSIVALVKGSEGFELIKSDIISEGSGSEVGEGKHPLTKESLESELKSLEYDEENKVWVTEKRILPKEYHTRGKAAEFIKGIYDMCMKEDKSKLSKSEIFDFFGKISPRLSYGSLEKLFNFTSTFDSKNNLSTMKTGEQPTVSPEALEKALQEIGALSQPAATAESVEPKGVEQRLDVLEKGILGVTDLLKQMLTKGGDLDSLNKEKKDEPEKEEVVAATEKKGDPEKKVGEPEEKLEKGGDTIELIKGLFTEHNEQLTKRLSVLESQLEKAVTAGETSLKRAEEVEKQLEKANQAIEDWGRESAGRKTVTTKRFLVKGHEGEDDPSLNVLSASVDKRQILSILEKGAMNNGQIIDQGLATALIQFETGNVVTQTMLQNLKKEGYSLVE